MGLLSHSAGFQRPTCHIPAYFCGHCMNWNGRRNTDQHIYMVWNSLAMPLGWFVSIVCVQMQLPHEAFTSGHILFWYSWTWLDRCLSECSSQTFTGMYSVTLTAWCNPWAQNLGTWVSTCNFAASTANAQHFSWVAVGAPGRRLWVPPIQEIYHIHHCPCVEYVV